MNAKALLENADDFSLSLPLLILLNHSCCILLRYVHFAFLTYFHLFSSDKWCFFQRAILKHHLIKWVSKRRIPRILVTVPWCHNLFIALLLFSQIISFKSRNVWILFQNYLGLRFLRGLEQNLLRLLVIQFVGDEWRLREVKRVKIGVFNWLKRGLCHSLALIFSVYVLLDFASVRWKGFVHVTNVLGFSFILCFKKLALD